MRATAAEAPRPPTAADALTAPAPGRPKTQVVDPATLLLFEVHYNDLTLTDGMAAYGDPADPLIPLGELTRLLELDVDVQPATGRVVGRIGQSGRSVVLDIATLTARDGARDVTLTADDVALTPTEIYLRVSALQRLLPLKFAIQADALSINLTPTELLPIDSRMQRDARAKSLAGGNGPAQPVMRVETPYRMASPPAFDIGIGVGAQSIHPNLPVQYDLHVGGDLFHSNFQGYLGSDQNGAPQVARATFERQSLNGRLLGPLHARVVAVGDVFTPGLDIGPRSLGGRGVSFSTAPLDQASIFNRIDLRGELPVGYDVELYINDLLVGTQNTASSDGRYEFLNVILQPGLNVIRTVLYGPRGERKEERRVINVGAGLLAPGQATLSFGAVEQNESLFRLGPFQNVVGDAILAGGARVVASLNYGVTSRLTVVSGLAAYSTPYSGDQHVVTVGARTSLLGFATQVDVAANDKGGYGGTVGVVGRALGTSVVLKRSQYTGGFVDETLLASDGTHNARDASELDLDSTLSLAHRSYPLSFRGYDINYTDGTELVQATLRGSSTFRSFLLSLGGDYQRQTTLGASAQDIFSADIAASTYRSFDWQLRADMQYEFLPEMRARTLELTAERKMSDIWSLRFAVSKPFDVPNGASATISSITRTHLGDFAVTGGYDNQDHGWRIGIQDNFSLAFDPAIGRYAIAPTGAGSGGAILVHAFIDANGDGVFNPGEAPAPKVAVEGGQKRVETNAEGYAYVTGFGASPTARVTINTDAVQDTMAVSSPPNVIQFSPRPGSITRVEYPLRPTGEIGIRIVLVRPDGQRVGLSATQIQLTDPKGTVIKAVTEFDGTALIESIPLGAYHLSLDPTQAARLRLKLLKSTDLVVKADGQSDLVAEVEFEGQPADLSAAAKPAEAAPPPPVPPAANTLNLDDTSDVTARLRRSERPPPYPPWLDRSPRAPGKLRIRMLLHRPGRPPVALSGAQVQLLGADGAVVAAVTDADGWALVPTPAAGRYRLVLDPAQARLRMTLAHPVEITITGDTNPDVVGEVLYDH